AYRSRFNLSGSSGQKTNCFEEPRLQKKPLVSPLGRCRYDCVMSFADSLDILYEDNHCLALNKPAGWPTTHFDGTEETVDRLVKAYLKEKHGKPGNVFLGVVQRLDKPTSGVLLFARTSKAAARLSEQFREGAVEKTYWAVTG